MGKGMKVLFLVFHSLSAHSGISKKILAQVKGLRQCGAEADLCCLKIFEDGSKGRTVTDAEGNETVICRFGYGLKAKLRKRADYSDIVSYVQKGGYGLVYIRYDINADPFTIALVRKLESLGVRVVVEIPTFPYDGEFKGQGLLMNLQLLLDKISRKSFFSHVDNIVLYSGPSKLWGCPVIHISNGIDFDNVGLARHGAAKPDGTPLKLLSVANIHLWHGLDRLIAGMAAHKETACELHIVGDGLPQIIESYRVMAKELGIADKVKILGPMYGEALDKEFEWADLAVGSLGRHRSGIASIKTLKNREYAARGLGFFYSETDEDFDNAPYVLKIPADESPVDVNALESFYRTQVSKMDPAQIRKSIEHLSWTRQMSAIL